MRVGTTTLLRALRGLLVLALPLALVSIASPAAAVSWDMTSTGDFGLSGDAGSGVAPDPLIQSTLGVPPAGPVTLSLTALTSVENGGEFDLSVFTSVNPMGMPAHVFFDKEGTGVKGFDGSGSKEISGLGSFGDEVLIMSFDRAMDIGTTSIVLENYSESSDNIFIYIDNTLVPNLGSAILEAAMVNEGGDTRRINFSEASLAAALTGIDTYDTLYIRAQDGHFFVGQFTAAVPEPGTLVLIGMGFGGLVLARGRRRRRRRRRSGG